MSANVLQSWQGVQQNSTSNGSVVGTSTTNTLDSEIPPYVSDMLPWMGMVAMLGLGVVGGSVHLYLKRERVQRSLSGTQQ